MHFGRRLTGKRSVSAESLYLLIVVAAAVVTAYWAARTIGLDLSFIENAASAVGFDESATRARPVASVELRVEATPMPGAPHCRVGEQPAYLNGMAALHQQVGGVMGTPLECEHADGALGNTVQQTSAGLAAYDSQRNTETFTDGWHHWALTPDGLVAWEGTSAEPPPRASAPPEVAVEASPDDGSPEVAVEPSPDDGSPEVATAEGDDGASDAVVAETQDDGSSDAVAVVDDDGSSGAAMTETQDDGSPEVATVEGDDGASDAAVAETPDDGSSQAVAESEDDASTDAVTDAEPGDEP